MLNRNRGIVGDVETTDARMIEKPQRTTLKRDNNDRDKKPETARPHRAQSR